jgi:hypothetical protein
MRVGMPVHLFAPLSFSSRDLSPMYCDLIHQKVIDDEPYVGSYRHVLDKGRYDRLQKLEKSENPAAPALTVKSFIKSVDKLFKQSHKLRKKSKTPRISLPNPQSIRIELNFYMMLSILLICIETNLDGKNHLLFSCRDITPTPPEALVLQH